MSAKKEDKKEEKPKDEPKKEGAEGDEGEAVAKPKSKKKLLILIVVGLLVVGGGVAGLLMSGVLGGEEGKKKTEKTEEEPEEESVEGHGEEEGAHGEEEASEEEEAGDGHGKEGGKKSKAAKPVFLDLPDIIANLSSPTPRPHFINLKLTLEIASKKDLSNIEDNLPRIKDAFNSYLREIRKEDLEGSAGMYRLENELMLRLDKLFGEGKVKDILFREIIVQ